MSENTKTSETARIFVAELDKSNKLRLTSVIDAVNAARRSGEATIDMQGTSSHIDEAKRNLNAVIESVRVVAELHGLAFESTPPIQLGRIETSVSWVSRGTIRLQRRAM